MTGLMVSSMVILPLAPKMYKNALDPIINVFLRRAIGIDTLSLAYVEEINIDK